MKKIIILALCAASFAIAAPKKCVTFADTAGDGCWVYWYGSFRETDKITAIYEIKGEQRRKLCESIGESSLPSCDKVLR